jgi:predicted Zn-dependent protease with MMP-like domain
MHDPTQDLPRLPPSLDDIDALAHAAWSALPATFRSLTGDVLIRVQDAAEPEVLAEFGLESPYDLTGLYQGVDLTRRSISDPAPETPIVFLYRLAILDEWIELGDVPLAELVEHVLVHEIGHHFGLDDERIDTLLDGED